jgi:glycogen debranching enzyme
MKQNTSINIHGYYADVVSSNKNSDRDLLLRCNAVIAIAFTPELFSPKNAISHLKLTEQYLLTNKSLGLKTLDFHSSLYIPYYDNNDDSTNLLTAHGYSYHNGPEWVWVYAYFVKAIIQLKKNDPEFKHEIIMSYFANHKNHIMRTDW